MNKSTRRRASAGRRYAGPPARGTNVAGRGEAEKHWQQGVAASGAGRWADALAHFERATALAPDQGAFWTNLAQAHRKLGDFAQAEAAARTALALDPADLLACKLCADTLMKRHRYADAEAVFVAFPPEAARDHEFHCEYGQALYSQGRIQDSIQQFILSFTSKPDYGRAHGLLSYAFSDLGMHSEAAECMRTLSILQPLDAQVLGIIVHQCQQACQWDSLQADTDRLNELIEHHNPQLGPVFTYIAIDSTPRQQLLSARISARFEFSGLQPLPPTARPLGERLRIAYVSGDFHHHATAMLLTEVLEKHDRERFEVFLYSYAKDDQSALRRRVMASSEHWFDAVAISDLALAQRMRDDGIDIAVDLKGFTRGSRTKLFGYRPAPVQVAWLGYPGTCGADFIDYIIGDPVVTPSNGQEDYSERIAQMPWSYQPNDRQRPLGTTTRSQWGLPEDAFVFCSFNNTYKIHPVVFDRWCSLMRQVPGSVFWMFSPNQQATRNLQREAEKRGVDPSRLVFASLLPQAEHLARLTAADLFLDTLPCNAHTTASDTLWAGVPLITCIGQTFAGRVAASLLRAADCEDLITTSLDEYEALALALARDPARLRAIRERLVSGREMVPLFDSTRFARDLEALFMRMAQRHRAGLPPDSLWA